MAESVSLKIENCISILSLHESRIKKTLGRQLITELCRAMKKEKMVSKSGDFKTTMSRFKSRLKSNQGKNADSSSSVRLIFQFPDVLRSISTREKILKLTDDIENDLKREIPPPAESSTSPQASPSSDETLPASKFVPSFPSSNFNPTSYSDNLQNTSSKPQPDCRFFMKPNGEITDPCTSTYTSDMPDHQYSGYLSTDNNQGLTMGRLNGGQSTNRRSLPEIRLMNPCGSTIPVEESGQQYSSLQMGGSNKRHSLQVETIGQQNPLESRQYDSQPQLQRLTSTASGSLEYTSSSQHQMRSYNTSKSLQDNDSSSNSSDVGHKRSKRKRHKSKSFNDSKGKLKNTKTKFDEFQTQHNQQEKALRTGYESKISNMKMEAEQIAKQHKETEQNLRKRHNSEVQSLKTKLKHAQNASRKQSQASLIDEKSNQLELRMKEIQEREIKLNFAESNFRLKQIEHQQDVIQLNQDRSELRESIKVFKTYRTRCYIFSFVIVFSLLELGAFLIFLAYFKLK